MANTLPIIPKRTSVAGRLPDASNTSSTRYINPGEISINLTDQKMYTSNGSQLFEIGSNLTNLSVQTITANGTVGSDGQHLMFDGSQVYWSDDRGYTGSFGYTGSQGVIGFTGSQGVGFTGSKGTTGYTGSQGVIGFTGSLGYTGSAGSVTPEMYTILSNTEAARDAASDSAISAAASASIASEAYSQISLFPDPYFDVIGSLPLTQFNGKSAIPTISGYTNRTWDPTYDHIYGEGSWVYDSANTGLMAFDLWHNFETADLTNGQTFSIAALVIGETGSVGLRARQFESQTTSYSFGTNVQLGTEYVTMNSNIQVLKVENITVAPGAVGTTIYLLDNIASNFRLLALWAVKSATIGTRPPPRQAQVLREKLINSVVSSNFETEFSKANWAVDYEPGWIGEILIGSDITSVSQTPRTNNFSGYGDVITPPANTFNAIQVSVQQATGGAATGAPNVLPWARIGCFIRTGTTGTSHTTSGVILARGYVDVNPSITSYNDLIIPLRDPVTGDLLTDGISPASYSDEVFHCVYGIEIDGTLSSLNQPSGARIDRLPTPRSYYTLYARVAESGNWSPLSGNPGIGIRHLMLSELNMSYAASDALKTSVGGESGVSSKVSVSLSDYGVPRGLAWHPELLVDWHRFRAMRLSGSYEQFDIAIIGDSWSDRDQRYVRQLTNDLMSELGDAGPGWIGFGFSSAITGNSRSDIYSVVKSGTWISDYGTSPTPNISNAKSSEAGAKYTVTASASATALLSTMRLYWTGTSDGVIRYRWNSGTWVNLNVQGSGFQSALLTNIPISTAWVLEIEVVSGSVDLQGLDGRSSAAGVRVHKLSNSGSHANRWATVNEASFIAALTQLNPKLVSICLGTNDRAQGYSPSSFYSSMTALIERIRDASPVCDLILTAPCENERIDSYAMVEYTNQQGKLADLYSCALLDLQYAFGLDVSVYKLAGTRPWFSDNVHPVDSSAANIIPAAFKRILQP